MYPFAMQARLAEAWLDVTSASFAMAGAMGAAAARSFDPWLPGVGRSYPFDYWGLMPKPAARLWPWSWYSAFGSPGITAFWQPPTVWGGWTSPFSLGTMMGNPFMPASAWFATSPFRSWSGTVPFAAWATPSMYAPSPAEEAVARFAASYRTASGFATATLFDALSPRSTGSSTSKRSPLSLFAL